jgi:glycosyltransferase involved in cell wall biosynthesis
MSPADDQLRILAARLGSRERVIEALSERLSDRAPDPGGLRSALEAIQGSRIYRLAGQLGRLAAPLRFAKRMVRFAAALIHGRGRAVNAAALDEKLRVKLDQPAPSSVAVGRGNFLVFSGCCAHTAGRIIELRLTRDDESLETTVRFSTRPNDFGFFAVVELSPIDRETTAVFGIEARLADGSIHRSKIARIKLQPTIENPVAYAYGSDSDEPLVAICMATYNPPEHLFTRQIESIIGQTHRNWVCIITDDGSPPEAIERIDALMGSDPRFRVYRNLTRLGFYQNFERCLSLVPPDAEFVALADHDDNWRREKLANLLAGFDDETTLVYSDMRVVTAEGECLSETFWTTRGNNYTDIASMLLANTLTGAAAMFRRRLLKHVLPFPVRAGDLYHDQWIGCVALALGKIGYVDRPLYDYVQHGRNVIGHCAPPPLTGWQGLRQVWSAIWPPTAWVRRFAAFGRDRYLRYAVVRQFATLLLGRCGDELVPARRKPLRRLATADTSWRSQAWLAMRGLWNRRVSLGHEYALLASVWWRAASGWLAKWQHSRSAAPPAPVCVHDWIPMRTGALNLLRSSAEPRRVNVLIAALDFQIVFGGYLGVFHLARKLAAAGRRVRLVITDLCAFRPRVWREQFQNYPGLESLLDRVEVSYAQDRSIPLPVHPGDQFLATSWWTAHVAHRAAVDLGRSSFVYLSQDYEPLFYPMSTLAALANESYTFPHHCIFSTELLRDYYRKNGLGVYAGGPDAGDRESVAFENAITPVGPVAAVDLANRSPRKVLFYARPEPHNARNLFDIGVMALAEAVRAGVFLGAWEFYGIGTSSLTAPVSLADGAVLHVLPRQGLGDYAATLKQHDVGLSLMYTPHPSLVPLEMASAGLMTVTNTYANKTAERLRAISPNLIATDATVPALVDGLRRAVAGVENYQARSQGARVNWSTDWDTSFPPAILQRINEFLDAGEPSAALRDAA